MGKNRTDPLAEVHMQDILETEFGGMNDIFARLYEVTKDPDHLLMAKRFDHQRIFKPLADGRDELKGLHANTQIPKFVGAAKEYEVTGDPYYERIASFAWETITQHRTFATGGTSSYEHWRTGPDQLASEIGASTAETCCSYNLLKLTKHLFTWNPKARYADYYERALFNAILASQNPENGMMLYFCSLKPGHWKVFNTPRDAFWCCTGTGIENHAEYGDSIYFHDDQGIYVNLFIPSELSWQEREITLRQETPFPREGKTILTLSTPESQQMVLRIRVPYWATKGVTLKINGVEQEVDAQPQSYLRLERIWSNNDQVEVTLPMTFHMAPLPDADNLASMQNLNPRKNYNVLYHAERGHRYELNLAAIMYGPLVLAGRLAEDKLSQDVIFGNRDARPEDLLAEVPDLFVDEGDPNEWIVPVEDQPLTFRTQNVGRPEDVTLVPFYQIYDRPYTIYWIVIKKLQPGAKYLKTYND
ncbi:glycoside hydrolase family 127 protein [Acidobacteria bacterium AH-259-G07]|nr:glycoside hydrolase family 127 protein [Acidobacteria bacterium AH-259-G07]